MREKHESASACESGLIPRCAGEAESQVEFDGRAVRASANGSQMPGAIAAVSPSPGDVGSIVKISGRRIATDVTAVKPGQSHLGETK